MFQKAQRACTQMAKHVASLIQQACCWVRGWTKDDSTTKHKKVQNATLTAENKGNTSSTPPKPTFSFPQPLPCVQQVIQHPHNASHNCDADEHKHDSPTSLSQKINRTKSQEKNFSKCRKRAQQRWCKWLTATESRIGHKNGLRERLGPECWQEFVTYANRYYKASFEAHFSITMKCCGKIEGDQPCPQACTVNPWLCSDLTKLEGLHLDHSYELSDICEAWKEAISGRNLTSWDDGVNGDFICHLLFGVRNHPNFEQTGDNKWRAQVHFRCGESKNNKKGNFCHETRFKHQNKQITGNDLKLL
jgi:hypothetical protein